MHKLRSVGLRVAAGVVLLAVIGTRGAAETCGVDFEIRNK